MTMSGTWIQFLSSLAFIKLGICTTKAVARVTLQLIGSTVGGRPCAAVALAVRLPPSVSLPSWTAVGQMGVPRGTDDAHSHFSRIVSVLHRSQRMS